MLPFPAALGRLIGTLHIESEMLRLFGHTPLHDHLEQVSPGGTGGGRLTMTPEVSSKAPDAFWLSRSATATGPSRRAPPGNDAIQANPGAGGGDGGNLAVPRGRKLLPK